MNELIKKLEEGCVYYPKRFSGDTHSEMNTFIDESATDAVMNEAANVLKAMQLDVFYEVVDITDDEVYYTLGFCKTLEEAKDYFIDFDDIPESPYQHDDVAEFQIRERKFGKGDWYKNVLKVRYVKEWGEDLDDSYDYKWRKIFWSPIKQTATTQS